VDTAWQTIYAQAIFSILFATSTGQPTLQLLDSSPGWFRWEASPVGQDFSVDSLE